MKSSETKPEEAKPVEEKPTDISPTVTTSTEDKPTSKPVATPVETKAEEEKPTETKQEEVKLTETISTEIKPEDVKLKITIQNNSSPSHHHHHHHQPKPILKPFTIVNFYKGDSIYQGKTIGAYSSLISNDEELQNTKFDLNVLLSILLLFYRYLCHLSIKKILLSQMKIKKNLIMIF